jgi:hypothetical protein
MRTVNNEVRKSCTTRFTKLNSKLIHIQPRRKMSTGGRGLVNTRHSRLCQGRLFHFFYDISTLVEAMEPRLDFKDPEEIIPAFSFGFHETRRCGRRTFSPYRRCRIGFHSHVTEDLQFLRQPQWTERYWLRFATANSYRYYQNFWGKTG